MTGWPVWKHSTQGPWSFCSWSSSSSRTWSLEEATIRRSPPLSVSSRPAAAVPSSSTQRVVSTCKRSSGSKSSTSVSASSTNTEANFCLSTADLLLRPRMTPTAGWFQPLGTGCKGLGIRRADRTAPAPLGLRCRGEADEAPATEPSTPGVSRKCIPSEPERSQRWIGASPRWSAVWRKPAPDEAPTTSTVIPTHPLRGICMNITGNACTGPRIHTSTPGSSSYNGPPAARAVTRDKASAVETPAAGADYRRAVSAARASASVSASFGSVRA
jgi:hypothetical protein